jgi:predicted ATPase/DNA-binding SARP family transcriptional activator
VRTRLLGPVELDVEVTGKRERALVVMLTLAGGAPVARGDLVKGLWGASPPEDPESSLSSLATRVAAVLPQLRVSDQELVLEVARPDVDALHLEDEIRAARAETDPRRAASRLGMALELRRGPALTGLLDVPFAPEAAAALEQLHLTGVEEHVALQLRFGRAADQARRLRDLVDAHPTRERLWALLMTALYRDYRAEEAVAVYAEARARIAEELGIEPGEALQQLEAAILRNDPSLAGDGSAEPRTTTPRAAGRIPAVRSRTFGRAELVERVRGYLDEPGQSVVTLTGLGGTGKTRVAAVVASALEDAGRRVVWVGLAEDATPAALLQEIAGGLDAATDDAGRLRLGATDAQSVLVVLDNYESLANGAAGLLTLLEACPQLDFLVTSRLALGLAVERVVAVPPLALPHAHAGPAEVGASPAVQLFVATAERAAPDFRFTDHEDDVAALCQILDGVPLALELAAARVRTLGLPGVLTGLRRNLDLLRTTAADVPERQRALVTTIEWSLGRLTAAQRRLAVRLAVFEEAFTLESAEAVCDDLPDVVEGVSTLMETGLLRATGSRIEISYALPRTVRAHLMADFESSPDAPAVRQRLADHLLAQLTTWAEQLNRAEGHLARARFEDEVRDIDVTVDWLLSVGRIPLAVDLTLLATPFWITAGRLQEALARAKEVLAYVAAESHEAARLHVAVGRLAYHLTDAEVATRHLESGVRLAERYADEPTLAEARSYLGGALFMTGDHRRGTSLMTQAVESSDRLGLYPLVVEALALKALSHLHAGELDEERTTHERRLRLTREHGDVYRTADTYNTLAEIALDDGDPRKAATYARECVKLSEGRLPLVLRDATITLARATAGLGDAEGARQILGQAVRESYRIGQTLAIAQCARMGGVLAFGEDDADLALRLFAAAQTLAPAPRGTDEPVEADFAAAMGEARAALADRAEESWQLGASMPLGELRERLDRLVSP